MILAITVANKKAQAEKYAEIVCGNSDYILQFAFDAEWNAYNRKTARFVFRRGDAPAQYIDVLFTGNTCPVPALYQIEEVEIGVYAGDIHTTAPARIPCIPCITDGSPVHADPPQDVYDQLLEELSRIEGGDTLGVISTAKAAATGVSRAYVHGDFIRWQFRQENNNDAKTEASLTVSPAVPCLLLACVMHRGDAEIAGEGWTKAAVSQGIVSADYTQKITVWKKHVQPGTYEVTVTQPESTRMSLKLIALYGASDIAVADNRTVDALPYTAPEASGKRRLYLLSSNYASLSGTPPAVACTDTGGLDLQRAEELRFSAFYDYQPEQNGVPSFSYYSESDYNANTMNVLAIDIEEA